MVHFHNGKGHSMPLSHYIVLYRPASGCVLKGCQRPWRFPSTSRASNSPALRGSLPPGSPAWTLFLPLSRQACKISHINEKNPSKHVKSLASVGKKTLENDYLANFHRHRLGGMHCPKKYQFRWKKRPEIKHCVAHQMQNFLRQGCMQTLTFICINFR